MYPSSRRARPGAGDDEHATIYRGALVVAAVIVHLSLEGIQQPSIGSVGDAHDNALMETISDLDKAECVRITIFSGGPYKTIADVEFESAHYAALTEQFQPA